MAISIWMSERNAGSYTSAAAGVGVTRRQEMTMGVRGGGGEKDILDGRAFRCKPIGYRKAFHSRGVNLHRGHKNSHSMESRSGASARVRKLWKRVWGGLCAYLSCL